MVSVMAARPGSKVLQYNRAVGGRHGRSGQLALTIGVRLTFLPATVVMPPLLRHPVRRPSRLFFCSGLVTVAGRINQAILANYRCGREAFSRYRGVVFLYLQVESHLTGR